MEPRTFKSERSTQIVIERKVTIKKGDDITVAYSLDENKVPTSATVSLNGESLGRFDLIELEEFLQIFFSEEF